MNTSSKINRLFELLEFKWDKIDVYGKRNFNIFGIIYIDKYLDRYLIGEEIFYDSEWVCLYNHKYQVYNNKIKHSDINVKNNLCFDKYKNNHPCKSMYNYNHCIKHLTNKVKIKIPEHILIQVELEYI